MGAGRGNPTLTRATSIPACKQPTIYMRGGTLRFGKPRLVPRVRPSGPDRLCRVKHIAQVCANESLLLLRKGGGVAHMHSRAAAEMCTIMRPRCVKKEELETWMVSIHTTQLNGLRQWRRRSPRTPPPATVSPGAHSVNTCSTAAPCRPRRRKKPDNKKNAIQIKLE